MKSVKDQVLHQVGRTYRIPVLHQVSDQVLRQVLHQVWNQVWNQVEAEIKK